MSPADLVAAYIERRRALVAAATPGGRAARELSDITDSAVAATAGAALSRLRSPWALLALGGWGARRLLPGSDLDFLVVTDAPAEELKPALEKVLYPLWDSGLAIGHQVRSRRAHARAVRDDLDTLTATLTGRFLNGDLALGERVLSETAAAARRRSGRLLPALAARERPGSPYLLEPDIKDGAGGQRDLDELAWTAAALTGSVAGDLGPLEAIGLLTAEEVARLRDAGEVITAARWTLHAAAGRPVARWDDEAAQDLGLDGAVLTAAMAEIHHRLLRVRARVAGRPLPWDRPGAALGAGDLLRLLDAGASSLPALEDAAWGGELDDLVPGFSDLMTLRRPALGHTYTVGAHSLRCATAVGDAYRRQGETPVLRALLAAALLHDAGKVQTGPGHHLRGAAIASTVLPRFGLSAEEAGSAVTLVREHLLLAETAATEDVHDEDVILRAAARVGSADLVGPLLALAEADAGSTGPGLWSPWHAAMAGDLASRIEAALSEDVEGAGIAERAESVRADALALLGPRSAEGAAAFLGAAHLRYLASQSPADAAAHAGLVANIAAIGSTSPPQVAVTTGPADGTWKVTVAAKDRPGLFAAIAGALAVSGLDILAADAFPAGDTALDVFVVRPDTLAGADESTWAAFERALTAALAGRLDLDIRLSERRRHYAPRAEADTTVSTERTASYDTAVFVTAADRVGLLYDLARAFADEGLDIRWAKASTRAGLVRDVFHVVDAHGEPVEDPGVLGHLAMRVRERA